MGTTEPTPSLLYAVKRLELIIRAHLDEMLTHSGVTTLQYTALTVLEHRDGISAAQLARDSFVTPQAMADMLRALEQRRLISRSANPASRRERLVYLTLEGRQLLADYASSAESIAQQMISSLTPHEAAVFRRSLASAWAALNGPLHCG